jgi:signal transduction histidine kinase
MNPNRILIVDDEERNVKLVKGMIMSEKYEVATATCGQDALEYLESDLPDLIVLDVMMPDIDGFEVCRRLKQDEATRHIPILMVTALMEKEHRVKAMEVGADDFLSKPVDRTELLVRVKSLLRIKSYHDKVLESYEQITAKNMELEKLEQTKEELTHMVVHDLMNPLSVISMGLDLLMFDQLNYNEEQKKTMQQCHYNCDELKRMIQSMLDIHKMEDGKLQPSNKELEVSELIEHLMESFQASAEYNQIELEFDSQDSGHTLYGDEMLIKRVISNLISNAIRHTPPFGKVKIGVTGVEGNGTLQLSVSDTGDGIDPAYHDKIFERFEQVDLKKSGAKVGSSGLGLAFCKMAVEAHGGDIWVESEGSGNGSTFYLKVPTNN